MPEEPKALIRKTLTLPVVTTVREALGRAVVECPVSPISDAAEADVRRAAMETLGSTIDGLEAAVQPVRARIHALRTELAAQAGALLDGPRAHLDEVRRVVGAWDERERIRILAKQAQERDDAHNRVVAAKMAGEEVSTADLVQMGGGEQVRPKKKGRTHWILEVDEKNVGAIRDRLIGLQPDMPVSALALQDALQVHMPTLRKLLANERGTHLASLVGIGDLVTIRSEERATSRRSTK